MTDHKRTEAGVDVTPAPTNKAEKKGADPSPNTLTATGAKIKLTVLTSNTPLTKRYDLVNGKLDGRGVGSLQIGTAEVKELSSLKFLQPMLDKLSDRQAISLGVYDTAKHGKKPQVVTKRIKVLKHAADDAIISKTLDYMSWPDGPTLVLLDNDNGKTFAEVRDILDKVMPELRDRALLQLSSTSSNISTSTGTVLKGLTGSHTYLVLSDGIDIDTFVDVLTTRLWLRGFGYGEVGNAGQVLMRAAFDLSVFSPERLVFESGAELGPGLVQKRETPYWRDGGMLEASTLTPVSADDRQAVELLQQAERDRLKGAAAKVKKKYVRTQMDKVKQRLGCDDVVAKRIVDARYDGKLLGSDAVTLSNGTEVTVAELITRQDELNLASCRDPLEPDYNGGRIVAIFYSNAAGGKPTIYSQAHGGRAFKLGLDYHSLDKIISDKHAANEDEWIKDNWLRLCDLAWLELDEQDYILNAVTGAVGMTKKTAALMLKDRWKTQQKDKPVEKRSLSDLPESTMSRHILKPRLADRLLVLPDSGTLYEYVGDGLWQPRNKEDLAKTVQDFMHEVWGSKAEFNRAYWANVSELLRNDLRISWPEAERLLLMNKEHRYIPFANGVFDVVENELRAHNRDMFFRWRLSYQWEPPPELLDVIGWDYFTYCAPKFEKLLAGQLDHHGRAVLIACLRATILGRADLQFYVEMVGKPGSGKSTLIHVIRAILGATNVTDTTMEAIETDKFELAKLRDVRAAFLPDASWYQKSVNKFKAITGHDHLPIQIKHKQQDGPGVQFDVVIWAIMNEAMVTTEKTASIERRKVPIYTEKLWTGPDHLKLEDEIVEEELPQIFNCIMEMGDAEMERLISLPVVSCPMKLRNFIETNQVAEYLDGHVMPVKGSRIAVGRSGDKHRGWKDVFDAALNIMVTVTQAEWRMYPDYVRWCEDEGIEKPVASRNFSKYVDKCGAVMWPGQDVKHCIGANNLRYIDNVTWK